MSPRTARAEESWLGEMLPFSITSVWGGGNVDDRRGAYRNCDRRQPVGWMTGRMNSSTGAVACSRQTRQMPTVDKVTVAIFSLAKDGNEFDFSNTFKHFYSFYFNGNNFQNIVH